MNKQRKQDIAKRKWLATILISLGMIFCLGFGAQAILIDVPDAGDIPSVGEAMDDARSKVSDESKMPTVSLDFLPQNLVEGQPMTIIPIGDLFYTPQSMMIKNKQAYSYCLNGRSIQTLLASAENIDAYMGEGGGTDAFGNRFGRLSSASGSCDVPQPAGYSINGFSSLDPPTEYAGEIHLDTGQPQPEFGDELPMLPTEDNYYFTRTPASGDDEDNDGMSDEWEIRYFARYAGQEVTMNETTYNFPEYDSNDPNSRMTFIRYIRPETDFDGDGFQWEDYFSYQNIDDSEGGEKSGYGMLGFNYLSIEKKSVDSGSGITTTESYSGHPPYQWPWQIGVPYVKTSVGEKFAIGDDKFTNAEEYTYNTNPTIRDTDGDGIVDEGDALGVNQSSATIELDKDSYSQTWEAKAHTFGETMKWNSNNKRPNRANRFARADGEGKISSNPGEPLQVGLTIEPNFIATDNIGGSSVYGSGGALPTGGEAKEAVKIKALITNIESPQENLQYLWFLNGEPITDSRFSGLGKETFIFAANIGDKHACDTQEVMVEISHEATGRVATATEKIYLGSPATFTMENMGPEDGYTTGVSKLNSSVLTYSDKTGDEVAGWQGEEGNNNYWASEQFLKNILAPYDPAKNPGEEGEENHFRAGDVIEFSAELIDIQAACPANYQNKLAYSWYYDNAYQESKSGIGNSYRKAYFTAEDTGASHVIRFEAIDTASDKQVAMQEQTIFVEYPSIEFEVDSPNVRKSVNENTGQVEGFDVLAGDDVTVTANLKYFLPPNDHYTYQWKIQSTGETITEDSPRAHGSFVLENVSAGTEIIDLIVTSDKPNPQTDRYEGAAASLTINVYNEFPSLSGRQLIQFGGLLRNFFPSNFQIMINVVFAVGLVGAFLLINHLVGQRKKKATTNKK